MKSACRVCQSPLEKPTFTGELLERKVDYYDCPHCGYVQTEEPDWLEQAYSKAINSCDTGIMQRNLINAKLVSATIHTLGLGDSRIVDCAGGYGILVRLLRDLGIDAFWSDPYCENLLAVGFEHQGEAAGLVTAFEALEHFVFPTTEVERLFEIAPNILFSTEIIANPAPKVKDWWYYGPSHGQHIGFFRERTLVYLAKKFNKHLCTDGYGRHLFSDKPVSKFTWKRDFLVERIVPGFFSRKLKSKVWSDFEQMSISE
jgi:hypothetical protein